jgi:antitoxin component of RelBE/YafQ-DinJ toxin-antitoxin module
MSPKKMPNKVPVSIRLDPKVKSAAEKMAKEQNRGLSNLIETLLAKACAETKAE